MNQDDSSFDNDFGALLRRLESTDEPCPDSETLIAWHAKELTGEAAGRIERHLEVCGECSAIVAKMSAAPAEVTDIDWARARRSLDARDWPWQRRKTWNPARLGMIAAGVAALFLVMTWLIPAPEPEIADVTRGAVPLTVTAPSGTVRRLEFRWQALPIHQGYVVEIERQGDPIAAIETFRPPLEPDARVLAQIQSGETYSWRVRAIDSGGRTLAESDWTEFQLAD